MSRKIRTAGDRKAILKLYSRISSSLARVMESSSKKRGGLRGVR
ncbi:MAG: hypothetical protein NTY45_07645 [Elusimicrobia bacterium]|nr:hypothetical protein [Elusimicrobiota bacterium]